MEHLLMEYYLLEIFKLSSGLKGPLLSKKRAGQVGRPDGELAKGFQYSGSYCGALAGFFFWANHRRPEWMGAPKLWDLTLHGDFQLAASCATQLGHF